MNQPSANKTMTVKEVAAVLNCSVDTIQYTIKKVFPGIMVKGKTTYLDELQVTAIKLEMDKSSNFRNVAEVPKTALEKELIIHQAMVLQAEKIQDLQSRLELVEPKAKLLDFISGSDGLFCLSDVGKMISGHPNKFCQWLLDERVIFRRGRRLLPMEEYQRPGYFKVKESINETRNMTFVQTFFTPKGVEWIAEKWRKVTHDPRR